MDYIASKEALMGEWLSAKNVELGLNPEELVVGSRKKAWWKCSECGYEWMTHIYLRQNHGCPKCAIRRTSAEKSIPHAGRRLIDIFPESVKCWNNEKNGSLRPEDVAATSNKRVWWKCTECGHEWQAAVYTRIKHKRTTCKRCSLKGSRRTYVKQGVNDLASVNKRVAREWDYEKNGSLRPEDVAANSKTQIWWKCEKGHEWQVSVATRTKSGYRGCPICSNRFIVRGVNDLATVSQDLAKEWNYEKNGSLRPEDVAPHSDKKVWWKCEKGHEWASSPNNRSQGKGCPYCLNIKVWPGFNDLATINPELAKEWNQAKNGSLRPEDVIAGSGKKVWWRCPECGYEWQAAVVSRNKNKRCPVCANRTVIVGVNDLATTNPRLAKEWNYEKNGSLRPEDIIEGSPKSVWWKCEKGHEWSASIVSRKKGANCPICFANRNTSVSEKAVGYYLEKYGETIVENKKIDRRELDIFMPNKMIAIEYDGAHYHSNVEKDLSKNKKCEELGIKLIRLREPGLPALKSTSVDIQVDKIKSDLSHLNAAIIQVLTLVLGVGEYDVDLVRDYGDIYSRFQKGEVKKSLANAYGYLLKEWNYEKNNADPTIITSGSHYLAWWKCSECGYEWQAPVYSRIGGKTGCRQCSFRKTGAMTAAVKEGQSSLASKYPELAKEWNYEKNGSLKPEDVAAQSNKRVWWKCSKCGFEWESGICNRTRRNKLRCRNCNLKNRTK